MKVTLTLSDDLATAVLDRPDPDELVERAVSVAVAAEAEIRKPAVASPSKWADLVKRIEAEVPSLGDYEPVLRHHQLEFRPASMHLERAGGRAYNLPVHAHPDQLLPRPRQPGEDPGSGR